MGIRQASCPIVAPRSVVRYIEAPSYDFVLDPFFIFYILRRRIHKYNITYIHLYAIDMHKIENQQIHIFPDMQNMYAGMCLHICSHILWSPSICHPDRMSKPGLKTSGFQWGSWWRTFGSMENFGLNTWIPIQPRWQRLLNRPGQATRNNSP